MITIQLHSQEKAAKLGKAYTRKELVLINQTVALAKAYNSLFWQRRKSQDADVRAALTASMRDLERFIDINLEVINAKFSDAVNAPKRRRSKAA